MKRELIQNVKAIPYTSGEAIDRAGFLSAVCAVKAAAAGNMKVAVTHADTSTGTFEAVPDACLFVGGGDEARGFQLVAVLFALASLVCYYATAHAGKPYDIYYDEAAGPGATEFLRDALVAWCTEQ